MEMLGNETSDDPTTISISFLSVSLCRESGVSVLTVLAI
jgi:hypothetical protein